MKTAISVPDELYHKAENLARRLKISRSELYAQAMAKYLAEHDEQELTRRVNMACDQAETVLDAAAKSNQRIAFPPEDW